MATIGSVLISVYAKTDGLRKSLKKAEKTITVFAKKSIKTLKKISVGLSIGITGAVAGITAIVSKYSAKIDEMAKFSTKFGLTVAALQKLHYQADLTGVSFSTMNMSIQKMVRNISEANQNFGTAKEELKEIGLDAAQLNKLKPDQQFLAIAEAMKQIGNQNDKVRIAIAIFGRSGTDVLNTMAGDLRGMSEEFNTLGVALTQSQARMVEAYNDSKTKLGAIFSGFGLQLTAQLAEPFKILIEWITKLAQEMGGMDKLANKFAKAFVSGIGSIIKGGSKLIDFFRGVKILVNEIKGAWLEMQILKAKWDKETSKIYSLSYQVKVNNNELLKLRNLLQQSAIDFNKEVDAEIKKLLDAIGSNSGGTNGKGGTGSGGSTASTYQKTTDAVKKLGTEAEKTAKAIGPQSNNVQDNVVSMKSFKSRQQAQSMQARINANKYNSLAASNQKGVTGFRGVNSGGLLGQGKSPNNLLSMQQYINQSKSGSALQSIRRGWKNGAGVNAANSGSLSGSNTINSLSKGATTKITLEMVTDAGKVAGELEGNQKFINAISKIAAKQTNQAARQAAN